jgi:hypothetical protein
MVCAGACHRFVQVLVTICSFGRPAPLQGSTLAASPSDGLKHKRQGGMWPSRLTPMRPLCQAASMLGYSRNHLAREQVVLGGCLHALILAQESANGQSMEKERRLTRTSQHPHTQNWLPGQKLGPFCHSSHVAPKWHARCQQTQQSSSNSTQLHIQQCSAAAARRHTTVKQQRNCQGRQFGNSLCNAWLTPPLVSQQTV